MISAGKPRSTSKRANASKGEEVSTPAQAAVNAWLAQESDLISIRPKELKKGRQYFQGTVWVDDRDLQIVKSEGKNVPELNTKKGENLFPRFTTYREQIDNVYWFPTYTTADDVLHFKNEDVHIRVIIKYTDYKRFGSESKIIYNGQQLPDSSEPKRLN